MTDDRTVLISRWESLTDVYIAQEENQLLAVCANCDKHIEATGTGTDNTLYWSCKICNIVFQGLKETLDHNPELNLDFQYRGSAEDWAKASVKASAEDWVKAWTELEVEVQIND